MNIHLETERLIIRDLTIQDLDGMFALDSNPEVHRYLGNKPIKEKAEALNYINDVQKQYKERGIGRWAVELKDSGEFIGWCGLRLYNDYTFNNHSNFYDIGYRLLPKFWGKGYATEASKACLQYAWNVLKLDTIYGITEIENEASHRILLKIGLNYVEDFYYEAENMQLRWYELKNPN
ncbi:RimJ/RimL family protein N-acetyltransferase [Kordia periserrulae]|uniref:RimJ/RimL family protein N-acetyltransferase n=1 Tax=Kordia periserrulae TaxID=701523 RepID=A0A2T6BVP5_9FLAO|nr:GNAT family N-acetyltransferase [Kordia periserrulae]PTX60133.1 RimJ/RimL family protein N-acetyltransferase [Kordia periserrulae]